MIIRDGEVGTGVGDVIVFVVAVWGTGGDRGRKVARVAVFVASVLLVSNVLHLVSVGIYGHSPQDDSTSGR